MATNDISTAVTIVVILYVFSSGFCMYLANRKGQNLKFWGVMGLIFGPGAIFTILFTNSYIAGAHSAQSLEERMNFFLEIGILDNNNPENVKNKIRKKYIEEWGDDFEKNVEIDDKNILSYGSEKVWWEDTEADVFNGNNVYLSTLKEWGNLSGGIFLPVNISEIWESDEGPITIEFQLNNKKVVLNPKYLEDYIDINLLKLINDLIPTSDRKFELLKAFDQTSFVIWLNKKEKNALIRKGWNFSW